MTYINNYEKFIENPKTYLVIKNDSIESLVGKVDYFQQQIVKYILTNIFTDVFCIDNLITDFKNIKFENNSVVYVYPSIIDYKNNMKSDKDKNELDNYLRYLLTLKNIDVHFIYNENTTGNKLFTHKLFKDYDFMPKYGSVINDINKIGFPLVVKPIDGKKGKGIEKINDEKELQKFLSDKTITETGIFDENKTQYIFTELINYRSEFRVIFLNDNIVFMAERIPNDKTNISIHTKKSTDSMDFVYVIQDLREWYVYDELEKIKNIIKTKLPKLKLFSIDFFLTNDYKIKVIEINSETGLDPISLMNINLQMTRQYLYSKVSQSMKIKMDDITKIFLNNEMKLYKNEIEKSVQKHRDYEINKNELNDELINEIKNIKNLKI